MKLNVKRHNRYLPKTVGVEVEACNSLMRSLKDKLPNLFPTGNEESDSIYECQTAPMKTEDFINVALLGEVTRKCLPNYIPGSYDNASASAHCHTVGFPYELEEEHIEALMVGLMPFMSIGWMRPQYEKYTFRSSVTGESGSNTYARLYTKEHFDTYEYDDRTTWIRNQFGKHRTHAVEMRTNENTILWVYFINAILTDQGMIDRLREVVHTSEYKKFTLKVMDNHYNSLDIYHDTIEKVKEFLIPFLVNKLDFIVQAVDPRQQVYAKEMLKAYLTENVKAYDKLIDGVVEGDDELAAAFTYMDEKLADCIDEYDVLKEI